MGADCRDVALPPPWETATLTSATMSAVTPGRSMRRRILRWIAIGSITSLVIPDGFRP